MNCPLCPAQIPKNVFFMCPKCWWTIPGNDRRALGSMLRAKQPTATKLAAVVRKMKEKQGDERHPSDDCRDAEDREGGRFY